MEKNNQLNNDNIFYKFRSLDKDVSEKVKCLLKGCHRIAKYSVSFFKLNDEDDGENKGYKQIVKFICSNHLENWDLIKTNLLDDKSVENKKQ